MDTILILIGVGCIIGAIVGGGVKLVQVELGQVGSLARQLLLAGFGVVLVVAGLLSGGHFPAAGGEAGESAPGNAAATTAPMTNAAQPADDTSAVPPPIGTPAHDVTTPAGAGAGPAPRCKQGFVWREAVPGDVTCVPPESRDQAKADNQAAAGRREPNGGPFGADTCRQGYVWRGAQPDDHVCVTPEQRDRTTGENNRAATLVEGG